MWMFPHSKLRLMFGKSSGGNPGQGYRHIRKHILSFLPAPHTCGNPTCGAPARHRCSRCKCVYYCSVECSTAHWSAHKSTCSNGNTTLGQNVWLRTNLWLERKPTIQLSTGDELTVVVSAGGMLGPVWAKGAQRFKFVFRLAFHSTTFTWGSLHYRRSMLYRPLVIASRCHHPLQHI